MTHKTLLLALTLVTTSTVICEDYIAQPLNCQEQEEKKTVELPALSYYSTHLATALGAQLLLDGVVAAILKGYIGNKDPLAENCALLIAVYIFYKAPQWTDDAIGIEEKRSFLSNVFSFLTRSYIPFPVGPLASEFVIRQNS